MASQMPHPNIYNTKTSTPKAATGPTSPDKSKSKSSPLAIFKRRTKPITTSSSSSSTLNQNMVYVASGSARVSTETVDTIEELKREERRKEGMD